MYSICGLEIVKNMLIIGDIFSIARIFASRESLMTNKYSNSGTLTGMLSQSLFLAVSSVETAGSGSLKFLEVVSTG